MLAQQERPTSPLHLVTEAASTSPAASLPGPNTVKAGLTPKRSRREVENDEYGAFIRRILSAYARRVGDGDVEAFILMTGLADKIDAAIAEAVKGLRAYGYSGAEIGSRLGITRQAAQQRRGYNVASPAVPHTTATGGKSRSPHTFHFGREQARASSPIRAGQRHRSSKLGITIRLAAIAVGCP